MSAASRRKELRSSDTQATVRWPSAGAPSSTVSSNTQCWHQYASPANNQKPGVKAASGPVSVEGASAMNGRSRGRSCDRGVARRRVRTLQRGASSVMYRRDAEYAASPRVSNLVVNFSAGVALAPRRCCGGWRRSLAVVEAMLDSLRASIFLMPRGHGVVLSALAVARGERVAGTDRTRCSRLRKWYIVMPRSQTRRAMMPRDDILAAPPKRGDR